MLNSMGNLMLWIQRNSSDSPPGLSVSSSSVNVADPEPFSLNLERIPIPVMMLNKQGVILRTNRTFQEFYGLSYEELTGANFTSLFENYSLSDFLKIHELTVKKPYIQQESAITTGFGETRWVQLHFTHLNLEKKDTLLLTLTDLTPLRSKAERISREYEQIKLLANAVIDAIFVVNSHGFVEWQNQMAQTLFGYKDDQVVGHSYIKLLPSLKKSSPLSNAIHPNGNFKNHSEVFELETKAANKDGNQIPVRVWVRRKRLRHRTIQIFIIRDMTRSLEAEPDRTQLREQVLTEIGQDLHDSIGGMLSGIALIGEQLVQQMKSQNLPINQKLEEVVDLIRETDELTHLLAKGMIRERQIQNGLNHSFKNLCDRVSRLFHVNCVFCGQKEELDLLSDEIAVQLYSIAEEAVGNAIRHGRADEIRVSIENCTEFLTLQVEDNGVGFAKHNNPGNGPQSKQISGGLGLNIMRKRAMQLGGQLKTDRTKDRKTLVRCTIPLKNLQFSPSKDPVLDKTALKETLIMD